MVFAGEHIEANSPTLGAGRQRGLVSTAALRLSPELRHDRRRTGAYVYRLPQKNTVHWPLYSVKRLLDISRYSVATCLRFHGTSLQIYR